MSDKEHLNWIYQRLVHRHDEDPKWDYMIKLKSIINGMDDNQDMEAEFEIIYGLEKKVRRKTGETCVCGSGKKFKKCCWSKFI